MALIKTAKGVLPSFGEGCFLADNATMTGDVVMVKEGTVVPSGGFPDIYWMPNFCFTAGIISLAGVE